MFSLILLCLFGSALSTPSVKDSNRNVTYNGFVRNGLDVFLNIKYGENTSGQNRFKPPQPYYPVNGAVIDATAYGPACPQPFNSVEPPITFTNVTNISEDCLNLNVVRPNCAKSKLPVLVWIHGGSFWFNSNQEITNVPDGLIIQSVENETPIIHVALNYRLGAFGFAQSATLKAERSENAGLRDQRLAIEWVRDNIEHFGGDPEKITIHGQSSGGLAVGMQVLAYGGSKPVPFQQAIFESQALENGITGNFTLVQMQRLVYATGCNDTSLDSRETIECLRQLDYDVVAQASFDTYDSEDLSQNQGDSWLPVVDGDFLPAAPSQLLAENRFANVTAMILWAENDMQLYAPTNATTPQDSFDFFRAFLPGFSDQSIRDMLALYPASEFQDNPEANLTREFYRTAQVFRDLLMTCPPIGFGENLARTGNEIYYISQNQSLLSAQLASIGLPGLGSVHTSEFPYTFGNLSHYNQSGFPFNPTADDYRLESLEAGSWAAFTSTGRPSLEGKQTLQGFGPAYSEENQTAIFTVGGPTEGLSNIDGPGANPAVVAQKLRLRCGFFNSPSIIQQLQY